MDKTDLKRFCPIGVLMGGCSSEREISFKSGKAVLKAFTDAGLDAVSLVIDSEEAQVNKRLLQESGVCFAFIALHGRYGEDGGIQTVLDEIGIPYAGSGPQASRTAMNKILTQKILKAAGLPVADFCAVSKTLPSPGNMVREFFKGDAVVIKPALEGSSIGIRIVRDDAQIEDALSQAFMYGDDVLAERFVKGRELTVGILGGQALPIVEIRTSRGFFDFEAKYQKGMTEYLVPADLPAETAGQIGSLALAAFQAVGCRDFARVDFLLAEDGNPVILEINTIPGFTETSLLPMAAACAGYDFSGLCVQLMRSALERVQQ